MTIRREMGVSHADLFRILPTVVESGNTIVEDDVILIRESGGMIRICYSQERCRTLGVLRLPVTDLDFSFSGLSQAEIIRFMQRFDFSFRRGGG